jgi:[ribosomal protein S5]-alanine N-acetyltransferase
MIMNEIHQPLVGQKITLRHFTKQDLDQYIKLVTDEANREPIDTTKPIYPDEIRKRYEKTGFWGKSRGSMLIIDNLTGEMVGEIAFFTTSPNIYGYELGYRIFKRSDRGKGYMSEALCIFSSLLFDWAPILVIILHIINLNKQSIAVAKKCGYKYIGTIHDACYLKGNYYDYDIYALHRNDAQPLSEVL